MRFLFSIMMVLVTAPAFAVPVLKLECRIDNSLSSFPRTIELRSGMIETVDCQKHPTCKNSIFEISMNYNSTYENVTVTVVDTETKKSFSTEHVLAPNTTGDSINNAMLNIGYGDVVSNMQDGEIAIAAGRVLSLNCDRIN